MVERRGTGNNNQNALKRGLSVLILKSCGILFEFDASPFAWGLFDLREEGSLRITSLCDANAFGRFRSKLLLLGWGTRSTPRLLRTIIALVVLVR